MPPYIPGARSGVRPQKGTRKANARAKKFSSGGSNKNKRARGDGDGGRPRGGFALLALLGAGIAALVAVVMRENAEYERENERIRRRLRSKPLATSEHAACRMDCRFISSEEAEETLREGKYDPRHSKPRARPCPRIALNHGRVRAVWADCADSTRLVTVIDTETNHPCPPC